MQEAINSALDQTYDNTEVLVINDGSTDETEKIALSYGDKIRYFSKPNGGTASALNIGIAKMRGEYFSWLSHDDIYYPNKILEEVRILQNSINKTELVFCGWLIIDAKGCEQNRVSPLERYTQAELEKPLFALLHGMLGGCGLLIHKSHFEKYGLFREDLPTTQDVDLWLRIMRYEPCRVCSEVLYATRVHRDQGSRTLKSKHRVECDKLWIGIMQTVTDEEKIEISGSIKNFWYDMYLYLRKYSMPSNALLYAASYLTEAQKIRAIGALLHETAIVLKRRGIVSFIKRFFL
jgi:glycosyltransferase involved in cell wall biosynthesis